MLNTTIMNEENYLVRYGTNWSLIIILLKVKKTFKRLTCLKLDTSFLFGISLSGRMTDAILALFEKIPTQRQLFFCRCSSSGYLFGEFFQLSVVGCQSLPVSLHQCCELVFEHLQ